MSYGLILIIGKAAIWLLIPLALGIWELRRHRRMMAQDQARPKAGDTAGRQAVAAPATGGVPRWLQQRTPQPAPLARVDARSTTVEPTAAEAHSAASGAVRAADLDGDREPDQSNVRRAPSQPEERAA